MVPWRIGPASVGGEIIANGRQQAEAVSHRGARQTSKRAKLACHRCKPRTTGCLTCRDLRGFQRLARSTGPHPDRIRSPQFDYLGVSRVRRLTGVNVSQGVAAWELQHPPRHLRGTAAQRAKNARMRVPGSGTRFAPEPVPIDSPKWSFQVWYSTRSPPLSCHTV